MDEPKEASENKRDLESHFRNLSTSNTPPSSLPKDWRSAPDQFLYKACVSGNLDVVQYILTEVRDGPWLEYLKEKLPRNLLWVCTHGHTDILAYLLDYGVDIGHSPMSTKYNEDTQSAIRVYEVLFQHGLELSRFPGILGAWIENETMLRYLLSKGADPNGFDEDDNLPLDLCSDIPIMKLLIDSGADVSRVNLLQESITLPNDSFSEELLEFLLEVGVDINARAVFTGSSPPGSRAYALHMQMTANGGTALHWVVRGWTLRGRPKVDLVARAKWLLDIGARVDIKDDNGLIPLDYAVDPLMIDLLNQYGSQSEKSPSSDAKV